MKQKLNASEIAAILGEDRTVVADWRRHNLIEPDLPGRRDHYSSENALRIVIFGKLVRLGMSRIKARAAADRARLDGSSDCTDQRIPLGYQNLAETPGPVFVLVDVDAIRGQLRENGVALA